MTTPRPITVLLADDQLLVRTGFRLLLDVEDDIEVVGEAGTGADAVAIARARRPDVVLMDIRMPLLDGIAATREIVATPGLARVRSLILTTYDTTPTCSRRCRRERAASCSRTAVRPSCCTASGWSQAARHCSPPGSPAA